MKLEDLKRKIRDVPNFPIQGIMFRDITTLLEDTAAFRFVIDHLYERYRNRDIDKIVAIESRGFIFGGALADRLKCGFVPARKAGKLPADTIEESYNLEYGTASLQLHADAIGKGQRILILDDLMATGGTLAATAKLVERLGGEVVEIAVLVELASLKGRKALGEVPFYSMVRYESEQE